MGDILAKVPKWLLAIAVFVAVFWLVGITFYSGVTGRQFQFWGQAFGFQGVPFKVKGWQYLETGIATQRADGGKQTTVQLPVKADEGACFVTWISGRFDGQGQHINVNMPAGVLEIWSDQQNTGLQARAGMREIL
jgi:hypothetical protein